MINFKPSSDDLWNIPKPKAKKDTANPTYLQSAHIFTNQALNDLLDGVVLGDELAYTKIRKDKLLSAIVNLGRLKKKLEYMIQEEGVHDRP